MATNSPKTRAATIASLPPIQKWANHFAYDPSTGAFYGRRGRRSDNGRRNMQINGYSVRCTHLAFALMKGRWPYPEMVIAHLDGDITNNRWSNLKEASHSENLRDNRSRVHRGMPGWCPKGCFWQVKQGGPAVYFALWRDAFNYQQRCIAAVLAEKPIPNPPPKNERLRPEIPVRVRKLAKPAPKLQDLDLLLAKNKR